MAKKTEKFEILSEVYYGDFAIKDRYIETFNKDENTFGRILKYHKRMYKTFPNREFKLISALPVKED